MEASRSYLNANLFFPPLYLSQFVCREDDGDTRTILLEIKQLHRLAEKGRVIYPHRNVYKGRLQVAREGKQQTWIIYFVQNGALMSPQSLLSSLSCMPWGGVGRTASSPFLGIYLINSISFMAEMHSFLAFLMLLYCSHLLLA